jgi:hypothetical protein
VDSIFPTCVAHLRNDDKERPPIRGWQQIDDCAAAIEVGGRKVERVAGGRRLAARRGCRSNRVLRRRETGNREIGPRNAGPYPSDLAKDTQGARRYGGRVGAESHTPPNELPETSAHATRIVAPRA